MSYHTFHLTRPDSSEGAVPQAPERRATTAQACHECRRRKTRCDGGTPCQQCIWYKRPRLCSYSKQPRKALSSSRAIVNNLQDRLDTLEGLFTKLYPGYELEQLADRSREDLVHLVQHINDRSPASERQSSTGVAISPSIRNSTASDDIRSAVDHIETTAQSSADAESLSALEQAPERDPGSDEAQKYGKQIWSVSDDVNALSISQRQRTSYVGVSSVSAALEVIFKLEPSIRSWMAQSNTETTSSSRRNSLSRQPLDLSGDPTVLPPADIGQRYIDSYFTRVHSMMPMIDEPEFRYLFLYTNRKDAPWLSLLNIVLALGALADPTSTKEEHLLFAHRVRMQFSLETFGSGNLFVLQGLGLLTGYYLHWLSRPNEANALMGAALRMAVAMGLHREFNSSPKSGTSEIPVETRRRTWWTLVCLDTWACMSTGRPSLGRLGSGITVKTPSIPEQTNNAQYLSSLKLLPLVHSVKFCKIATRIQDKLAEHTLIPIAELHLLDNELVQWYDDLPPILRNVRAKETIPEQLLTPRLVMYCWYMTLRILAHRPLLLATALRRLSFDQLSAEEQSVVSKCRELAANTIQDIDQACPDEVIADWNAVWIMYQAAMVPMVSLCLHTSIWSSTAARGASDAEIDAWRQQIHTAIAFFDRKDVHISRKCKVMVTRLYNATSSVDRLDRPFAEDHTAAEMVPSELLSVGNDSAFLTSDMNLDDWLQSYDDMESDDMLAWNDAFWRDGIDVAGSISLPQPHVTFMQEQPF